MSAQEFRLAEYAALKAEQIERIKARDSYMDRTLVVIVAAVAAAAQAKLPDLLLAVPPACAVLGWTRLRNDAQIVAIRQYVRDELAPLVQAGDEPVFGWETGPRSRLTVVGQLVADLLTFVAPAAVALVVWVVITTQQPWGVAAAFAGAANTGVLLGLIVRHSGLRPEPRTGVGEATRPVGGCHQ